MVKPYDVFDRIRKIHSLQDVTTNGWVNLHLCEFCFGQLAGFVQDVFRHRKFADVVQQRAGHQRTQFRLGNLQQLTHLSRIDLCAANVTMRCLILRVDRDRQRLDRVHVKISDLFDIAELVGLRTRDLADSFLIESIQQVNQRDDQRADK